MRLLALSGSRNHEGRTSRAINALCQGVVKAGGNTETIFLIDLNLERCRQCEIDGWGICRREGRCIIDDDFDSVVAKIKAADVVLFATPVYFGDLSESMRSFLERLRRIRFRPGGQRSPGSLVPSPPGAPVQGGIPAVGLCLSGGGGGGGPSCAVSLERIVQTCGFDIIDWILLRRQNFEVKVPMLQLTGEWLATKPTSGPPGPPR